MIAQSFEMAMRSILSNKMRAFLTMLGIIIGVASVVVLVGIGQGSTSSVTASIENMGTNLLTVNVRGYRQASIQLTLDELTSLSGTGGIDGVAPTLTSSVTAKAGTVTYDTSMIATTADYESIKNQGVSTGRFIKQTDVDNKIAVAVIGTETAEELFGHTDVVGEEVSLLGRTFKIVGVLSSKGSTSQGSSDDQIIIPFSMGQQLMSRRGIQTFYASAESSTMVDAAQQTLEDFMLKKYMNDDSAFTIFNQSEMLTSLTETTNTLSLMLAGIAGIALLVGGIGIMNIMLVSVTERTREIGIRKAIGAGRGVILSQFLIEALLLSLMGGLLGLGLSYALSTILQNVMNMTITVSPAVAGAAVAFSMVVGIIFGLYPANKASKLRPIQALRYEG